MIDAVEFHREIVSLDGELGRRELALLVLPLVRCGPASLL
jgi:hypothetical protein